MAFFATTAYVQPDVTPKTVRPEPQLSVTGSRSYSPGLGRWASKDPLGEVDGGNLYAAFGNAPVGRIDPLGLTWVVVRAKQRYARAWSTDSRTDTLRGLALDVGLEPKEVLAWARKDEQGTAFDSLGEAE
jgi:RHS repeat-associated protein